LKFSRQSAAELKPTYVKVLTGVFSQLWFCKVTSLADH